MTTQVQPKQDNALVRSVKDILAGTVAGVGITLVGHPFVSSHTRAMQMLLMHAHAGALIRMMGRVYCGGIVCYV